MMEKSSPQQSGSEDSAILPSEEKLWIDLEQEPSILIRGLNHYFGKGENKKQVLFDINLEIDPGELVIMTGPSGSGKTTLLTLIGALRSVQEGSLQVMKRELKGLKKKDQVKYRRDIGFIFQMHNLFESLTAYQNVRMALEVLGKAPKNAEKLITDMLAYLGLQERIKYKPDSLSGGQKQRVAVARALVSRPKLVLADEPTAALDKKSGRDVVELFKKMAKEELCTILMVTHDNRILDVADRIINMVDGQISSNVLVKESITICKFLQRCKVFKHMPPSNLTEIAQKMRKERHGKGSRIIRQGDTGDKYYIIGAGKVEVIKSDGKETKIRDVMDRGESFGETALITKEPRNATCMAKTECLLYSLDKDSFEDALDRSAPFIQQLLGGMTQR